jgi:hypothetical protein
MTEPSGRTKTVLTRLGSGNGVGGAAVAEPPPPELIAGMTGAAFEAVAETGVIGAIERVGEASAITAGAGVGAGATLLEDAAAAEELVDAGADAVIDAADGAATTIKGAAAIVGGL